LSPARDPESRTVLAVIAGPNGSGKTTLTENALRHEWLDGCAYINPDRIAQDLFGDWNSPDAVLKAARNAEGLRRDCLDRLRPFAFETVFSTVEKMDFLREARGRGFFIRLFFVGTDGPEINASRVMRCMQEGGHAVPIDKILSRYERSITNLYAALRVVDRGYVYDNSVDFETQRLLFRTVDGCVEKTYDTGHEWAERVRRALPSCTPDETPGLDTAYR
jgi:predicted ABC-type ATPase